MARDYITISIEIMHNKDFNNSQKFIYAEIRQLSSLEAGCIASNQHFSELIGITRQNVSKNINELKTMGYIDIEIRNGTRNHERIISLRDNLSLTKTVNPPYQNNKTPLLKQQETKGNIQINKTINIGCLYCVWFKYPDNKGRDSSFKNIPKLIKKYKIAFVLTAIDRYIEYVQFKRAGGFKSLAFKNASTFFNSGIHDYLIADYESPKKEIEKVEPKKIIKNRNITTSEDVKNNSKDYAEFESTDFMKFIGSKRALKDKK